MGILDERLPAKLVRRRRSIRRRVFGLAVFECKLEIVQVKNLNNWIKINGAQEVSRLTTCESQAIRFFNFLV